MIRLYSIGLILLAAAFSSGLSASTYSAGDQNFQPLNTCTDLETLRADRSASLKSAKEAFKTSLLSKRVGRLLFIHHDDAYPACKLATWSDKACKKGEWQEGQSGELTEIDYTHDYTYTENSMQITNPYDWTITSIDFEYKKLNGTIIYELKLENLNVKKAERALITNLPDEYRFHDIESIKVSGPKKAVCLEYFSDEEIEEKEKAALLKQQKNEEQAKTKQKSKPDNSVLGEKIFTNCIEDKMPTNPEQTYKVSILSICKRASENPTFWNKIWYDYLGQ